MSFKRSQMLYNDGSYYKWKAEDSHDDPSVRTGVDYVELNRTEGYEVLHFITQFGKKYFANNPPSVATYQKLEEIIRFSVPHRIQKHKEISVWIIENWSNEN